VEFTGDFGSGFAVGKDEWPLFVTSNWCFPVTDTPNGKTVVFLACEIIQLFCLLFCMVKAVNKFDFRLAIKDKHYVVQWWRLVFLTGTLCFVPTAVASFAGLIWLCSGQLHALGIKTVPVASCIAGVKVKLWLDVRSRTSEIQQRAFRHTATDVTGKFADSNFDV
jgi:hypothetical protein